MIQAVAFRHAGIRKGKELFYLRLWNEDEDEVVINIGKGTFEKVCRLVTYGVDNVQEGVSNELDNGS